MKAIAKSTEEKRKSLSRRFRTLFIRDFVRTRELPTGRGMVHHKTPTKEVELFGADVKNEVYSKSGADDEIFHRVNNYNCWKLTKKQWYKAS